MSERNPPLTHDLPAAPVRYSSPPGGEAARRPEAGAEAPSTEEGEAAGEEARLRAEVRSLTAALEDIVTFALSGADYKERAIAMHRRAVAALSEARDSRR